MTRQATTVSKPAALKAKQDLASASPALASKPYHASSPHQAASLHWSVQRLTHETALAPRELGDMAPSSVVEVGEQAVVQRNIGAAAPAAAGALPFHRVVNANNQTIRPPFVGHWADGGAAHGALAAGQSRNHVISHHHIAEALTNLLNLIYQQRLAAPPAAAGAAPAPPAAVAQLVDVTDSLYVGVGGAAAMAAARTTAVNSVYAVADATPAGGAALTAALAQAATDATALEQHLTSAPDNVRAGDANLNQRIGNNIDAQYTALINLPAYANPAPAFLPAGIPVPAPWMAAAGAQWGRLSTGVTLAAGAQFYCMIANHNRIVWNFMTHAVQHMATNLTVVRNDDPRNMVPGYTGHSPLSSSGDPAPPGGLGAASRVLIFDPTGAQRPQPFN